MPTDLTIYLTPATLAAGLAVALLILAALHIRLATRMRAQRRVASELLDGLRRNCERGALDHPAYLANVFIAALYFAGETRCLDKTPAPMLRDFFTVASLRFIRDGQREMREAARDFRPALFVPRPERPAPAEYPKRETPELLEPALSATGGLDYIAPHGE